MSKSRSKSGADTPVGSPPSGKSFSQSKKSGRYDVPRHVRELVWIRAAGHCERCGADLTVDLASGRRINWGDVAHIEPASADGPRALADYSPEDAARLTSDPANLMLLCPGDHRRTDRAAEAYAITDLQRHHRVHLNQIRHAARRGETQNAEALIILGQHWATEANIRPRELQDAMLEEGFWCERPPATFMLTAPGAAGRDDFYWQSVERDIDQQLEGRLRRNTSSQGDALHLCMTGLADIPSLLRVGRQLGDRSNRVVYPRNRDGTSRWPSPDAACPAMGFRAPSAGEGPIALVLSLSAAIPEGDVIAALPNARIAHFTTKTPRYDLLRSRRVLLGIVRALQARLSELEAATDDPIHLFAAIPAALAIEIGALLSTQHAHRYEVYDREGEANAFVRVMELAPRSRAAFSATKGEQSHVG